MSVATANERGTAIQHGAPMPFRTAELVVAAMALAAVARFRPPTTLLGVPLLIGTLMLVRGSAAGGRRLRSSGLKLTMVCVAALAVGIRSTAMLGGLSAESGPISFRATLRTDPVSTNGVTSVVADVGGDRFRFLGRGLAGASFRNLEAGEQMVGRGRVRAVPLRSWRVARGLDGDISVESISDTTEGTRITQFCNGLRRTLLGSARHFDSTDRALFSGFVLGDARDQPVWVSEEFRAAGLTHLLVVSGQNVAFVLAMLKPLLSRVRRNLRLVLVICVLMLFATLTRFEPSVQRAAVMAALSSGALTVGRPQGTLRILATTVCVLLFYNPLLAWSVGFGLSVGACAGLAILTPRLEAILRGPRILRSPLATSIGAQAGASLVMVPIFGAVPVVSVLANLVALPAAEPIMSWGIAVGVPAGLVSRVLGQWPAQVVHIPTQLCLGWVRFVARIAGQLPLGNVTLLHCAIAVVLVFAMKRRASTLVLVAVTSLLFALPAGFSWFTAPPSDGQRAGSITVFGVGGRVNRHVDVLVLDHGTFPAEVLHQLRRDRIRAIDLVVVRSGGRLQREVLRAIAARHDVGAVLAGERAFAGPVRPFIEARTEMVIRAGQHLVVVDSINDARLQLRVVKQ